jgi:hypothetical protein
MRRYRLYVPLFAFFVLGPIRASAIDCPAGFLEVTPSAIQGTLGCVQVNGSLASTWEDASLNCFDQVGGRLPTVEEWFVVWNNFSPPVDISPSGPLEWTADTSLYRAGITPGGDPFFATGVVGVEIISAELFATRAIDSDGSLPYRCFVVPEPSASLMLPAGASALLALAKLRGVPLIQ